MKIKIKGKEYEVADAQAAIDALESELVVATAKAERAAADLVTGTSDAAIDKVIKAREATAKAVKDKADKVARIKKAYPSVTIDDKTSDAFLDGLDVGAKEILKETTDEDDVEDLRNGGKETKDEEDEAPARGSRPLTGKAAMLAALKKK